MNYLHGENPSSQKQNDSHESEEKMRDQLQSKKKQNPAIWKENKKQKRQTP